MDTRSELKTFIAVMIAGFGLLLIGQLLVRNYMGWFDKPWDIFIFFPPYYIWFRYGAEYFTELILGHNESRDNRKNKKNV